MSMNLKDVAMGDMANKHQGRMCHICSVFVPNEASWQAHSQGQKHTRNVTKQEQWRKTALSSVYVGGIKDLPVAELSLADYFSRFGTVKKITIDKTLKQFAIVELDNEEVVQAILGKQHHVIDGVPVVVKAREIKSLAAHKQAKSSKQKEKEIVIGDALTRELIAAESIDNQLMLLQERLQLTEDDLHLRRLLCQLLETALQEILPDCHITQFGSSANGFGVHGCDLDLNLDYSELHSDAIRDLLSRSDDSATSEDESPISTSVILSAVAEVIKQCVPDCHKIKPIFAARLPVVRFYHKASKMRCDISLSNHIALRNTEYLRLCTRLFPQFRSLVFMVRAWMKHWELAGGLNANGPRLNNYAVTLMVLFYLQHEGNLPSLTGIRSNIKASDRIVINDCDCSFPTAVVDHPPMQDRNSSDLIAGFFTFYAKLDFPNIVLDLCSATLWPVSDLASDGLSLGATARSKAKVSKPGHFKVGSLNVRDPFELHHNTSGNVNEKHLKLLTKRIRNAALACKMQRYLAKGKCDKWGILNLFVDHHNKDTITSDKPKRDLPTSFPLSIPPPTSGDIRWSPQSVVMLVLTVLRDVFLISLPDCHIPTDADSTSNQAHPSGDVTDDVTSSHNSLVHSDDKPDDAIVLAPDGRSDLTRKRRASSSPDSHGYLKRAKLLIESPTNSRLSMAMGKLAVIELPFTCECIVSHRLWEGRRKARRRLVQKGRSDLLDLEREVSKLILTDRDASMNGDSFDTSCSSNDTTTAALFHFTLTFTTDENDVLCLNLHPRTQSNDFITFFHHLEIFLPGFVLKCFSHK